MENKQLEQEYLKCITHNGWDNGISLCFYKPLADGYEGELDDAVKACASITLKHMKGFVEWNVKNGFYMYAHEDKWSIKSFSPFYSDANESVKVYTTEQLIELYFESLNKDNNGNI